MDRYLKLDIERFLKDSLKWDKKIHELNKEIDNMYGLKELATGDPVQTSNISNPTEQTAVNIAPLKDDRERLTRYKTILADTIKQLEPWQEELLDIFFFHPRFMPVRIEGYAYKYGIERSTVYNRRRETLNQMVEYIQDTYL